MRSGVGRSARLQDLQPDGLNWWWWNDGYSIGLGPHPDSGPFDWVTPAERRQADGEWTRIVGLGEGHDWLYSSVIAGCDRANAPPACAEALYRAGTSFSAIGYWHDPAWSEFGSSLDYPVQPILDRPYKGTIWQRHYQSDSEALKRIPSDENAGARGSIPYPR